MFCYDGSDSKIKNANQIIDNTTGIKCDDSSDPLIRDNSVTGNGVGISAFDSSDPDLGNSGGSDPGNNTIHSSTSFHVANWTTALTLKAEGNFWNNTYSPCFPHASKISGSVDYDPSLCSDPQAYVISLTPKDDLPISFGLSQNYPNPFNPVTVIQYQVPSPGSQVTITLYNVIGQLVIELVHEVKAAGYYDVTWNGTDEHGASVASGVYLLRMRGRDFEETRKIVFMK